jgi:hypothetical protein
MSIYVPNTSRLIYLDKVLHKYTDDLKNVYISTTTQIGKYAKKFDTDAVALACEKIGRNPNHPKYLKYKGKSKETIIKEWDKTRDDSLVLGNDKHDYLETSIKSSNGYKKLKIDRLFKDGRLYTILDVMDKPKFGNLSIKDFEETKMIEKYPEIAKLILHLFDKGYLFYPEIAVYNYALLKTGLIDNLVLRSKDFYIVDWKTNRDDLVEQSGYFEKDLDGNVTTNFIVTDEYFSHPLSHLKASNYWKYALQLSDYANMCEQFGLTCKGLILCHLRRNKDNIDSHVDIHQIPYLKNEVKQMGLHYYNTYLNKNRVVQRSFYFETINEK